jgi:hypothetical protein
MLAAHRLIGLSSPIQAAHWSLKNKTILIRYLIQYLVTVLTDNVVLLVLKWKYMDISPTTPTNKTGSEGNGA